MFPVPIFNHKKPRQAVISDPQMGLNSTAEYQGFRGQERSQVSQHEQYYPKGASQETWQHEQYYPKGASQETWQHDQYYPKGASTQWTPVQQQSNACQPSSGQSRLTNQQPPRTQALHTPSSRPNLATKRPFESSQRGPGLLPLNPRAGIQRDSPVAYDSHFKGRTSDHGVNQRGAACASTTMLAENRFDNQVQRYNADISLALPRPSGDGPTPAKLKVDQPVQQTKNRKDSKTTDISMHFLTCGISDLKRWSNYKDQIAMMFEIFGMVDSAMLPDSSGTGREFKLKDESDTVQCIFYEIDRTLPRLIRGQWYRCVGSLHQRTQKMRCVSVRVANADERNMAKYAREISNRTMEGLTRMLREL